MILGKWVLKTTRVFELKDEFEREAVKSQRGVVGIISGNMEETEYVGQGLLKVEIGWLFTVLELIWYWEGGGREWRVWLEQNSCERIYYQGSCGSCEVGGYCFSTAAESTPSVEVLKSSVDTWALCIHLRIEGWGDAVVMSLMAVMRWSMRDCSTNTYKYCVSKLLFLTTSK